MDMTKVETAESGTVQGAPLGGRAQSGMMQDRAPQGKAAESETPQGGTIQSNLPQDRADKKKDDGAPAEIRISVRGLVEFILRHGDLDNRHQAVPEDAMQEGGRIHRKIQKRMGAEYQAEVSLKHVLPRLAMC